MSQAVVVLSLVSFGAAGSELLETLLYRRQHEGLLVTHVVGA